jgi:hypothetical protein
MIHPLRKTLAFAMLALAGASLTGCAQFDETWHGPQKAAFIIPNGAYHTPVAPYADWCVQRGIGCQSYYPAPASDYSTGRRPVHYAARSHRTHKANSYCLRPKVKKSI